jgi:hypothetical protein
MTFRKLRIAWSVFCGPACVLLIVLAVRSNWRGDVITCRGGKALIGIESNRGRLAVFRTADRYGPDEFSWSLESYGPDEYVAPRALIFVWPSGKCIGAPHWFGVFALAGLAAFPWLRWRFSLRTLLIATTLVAVVLGLAVWAGSK